ncbi:MAG: phosphoenolpyruvate--protein phosphotransferase [Lachnospiraceae bacterium]|nr:phosphoenolpyruvate--protein phosphotransferase [Lachnospiraceae bacterium]
MRKFMGKPVSGGVARGRICLYQRREKRIRPGLPADSGAEFARFEAAVREAEKELTELSGNTPTGEKKRGADIFAAQLLILQDAQFTEQIRHLILDGGLWAEQAVEATGEYYAKRFEEQGDMLLRERAVDVRDVAERIGAILAGGSHSFDLPGPVILAAEDLTPSETIRFDRSKILGIVTHMGSAGSHAAILARMMGVPAVTGICVSDLAGDEEAVLDGEKGELVLDPDAATLEQLNRRIQKNADEERRLQLLRGEPAVSKSGKQLKILANIGSAGDIDTALADGAEGVGLFRSEFLFLGRKDLPSEEEQFEAYKEATERMQGKRIVIRTLDLGADKQAECLDLGEEENPALGYRAIRICLDRPDLFRSQLRAILRASAYGETAICLPMIISREEVQKTRVLIEQVKSELKMQKIPFRADTRVGIMIETPAAALISAELAKDADFFSIGTNDLTQYALAVDRRNEAAERYCNPHHPAVLQLIRMTVEGGHSAGIPVGICGELAADLTLTQTFLDAGVDELSVAPSALLPLRDAVRRCN